MAFPLDDFIKMQVERSPLRKELLSKKDPTLNDLGGYQPIWITKNDIIKKIIVEKACSGQGLRTCRSNILLKRLSM